MKSLSYNFTLFFIFRYNSIDFFLLLGLNSDDYESLMRKYIIRLKNICSKIINKIHLKFS